MNIAKQPMTLSEMKQISEVTGAVADEDVEMSEAKSVQSDQQAPQPLDIGKQVITVNEQF